MKDFNAAIRGGRVKSFPSSKTAQLNHHVNPTLQEYTYLDNNDYLRCKNDEWLKEQSKNKIKVVHTFQGYNIGKIYISSIVTCTRTFANKTKINEDIKSMCISNNFEFLKHNWKTAKYLWKDGVHLRESGKAYLARNLTKN